MKISVVGCGYLGAVHAASMASLGHEVIGLDTDPEKVATLSAGISPIYEPGLQDLLGEGVKSGLLRFTTNPADVEGSSCHFIAVGTPQIAGGMSADLTHVDAAIRSILPFLRPGDLLVGKSTVPVGTAERIAADVAGHGVEVAWNPEFLREGYAIEDTISPDRIVYGLRSAGSASKVVLDNVYKIPLQNGVPLIVTDLQTAELVKVAANAFLATKISFINAMADIADRTGADVAHLADAIGLDGRIGRRFLNAGLGFGGGCLPKDIRAFVARAEEIGAGDALAFLTEVDRVNLRQREMAVARIVDLLGGRIEGRHIAVLGLAFKPNSDDVRDSPAIDVALRLAKLGARVTATDPQALVNSRAKAPLLDYRGTAREAAEGADLVLLATEWSDYRSLDPEVLGEVVNSRLIFDARNALDASVWRAAGWTYVGIGRR